MRIIARRLIGDQSEWAIFVDRLFFWKAIAVAFLLVYALSVGISGYRAANDWQRIELEKAKIILRYIQPKSEGNPKVDML